MIRLNRAICSGDCTGNNPPPDPAASDQAHPPRHCILLFVALLSLIFVSISCWNWWHSVYQNWQSKHLSRRCIPHHKHRLLSYRSSLCNFSSLNWEMLLWMYSYYQVGVHPWLEPCICGSVQPAPAVLMLSATVHTLTELHCLKILEWFHYNRTSHLYHNSSHSVFVQVRSSVCSDALHDSSSRTTFLDAQRLFFLQPHERLQQEWNTWCRNNPCHVKQPHRRHPRCASVQPSREAGFVEQLAPNAGHVRKGGGSSVCC